MTDRLATNDLRNLNLGYEMHQMWFDLIFDMLKWYSDMHNGNNGIIKISHFNLNA